MELKDIKGLGPKTIEALNKLRINTYNDLVRYYPYRYNIYSPVNLGEVTTDDIVVVSGIIESSPKTAYIRRNFTRTSFQFLTSNIRCSVSIFNRTYLNRALTIGRHITLIGRYNRLSNSFTANDIKFFELTTTKLEPVYHTSNGVKRSTLKNSIEKALSTNSPIYEIVPGYLQEQYNLLSDNESLIEIHNPTSLQKLKQAKLKLKYEELFEFMFKINMMKIKNQINGEFVEKDIKDSQLQTILDKLPFTLTDDQLKAIDDVIKDFRSSKRMNRLILGDVGSGKTMVAFVGMLLNKYAGYQSAMLAPTEVLARQHYDNLLKIVDPEEVKVELLVGSQRQSEKNIILEKLKNNEVDILIGTHAILEERVVFNNIGLVITDEQHRFGVNQRKSLQNKGKCVDVIYMSATPIPRTYALSIYGDMDISEIKQKPSGRKEIITTINKFEEMEEVCNQILEELSNKHQVYVISPLIEEELDEEDEENNSDLKDISTTELILRKYIPEEYKIGILHGKMKNQEKDLVMEQYKNKEIDILISTTVIEVGVDVKNATMMVIFNAERFGLATLHQLRGRVGRNELQSKCILVSNKETERLEVLTESNDGFYISEKDFELRGSGDLFGIRQSGDMEFKMANIQTDYKILLQCKKDSDKFIENNIENNFREYPYFRYLVDTLGTNN